MTFHVARAHAESSTRNTLVLVRPKLAHISVLLRSNSGAVPLADRGYRVVVGPERIVEGRTDSAGLVEIPDLAPGDYVLDLDGLARPISVPTTPAHITRRPMRVPDLLLFEREDDPADDPDDPTPDDEADDVEIGRIGGAADEPGWTDVDD